MLKSSMTLEKKSSSEDWTLDRLLSHGMMALDGMGLIEEWKEAILDKAIARVTEDNPVDLMKIAEEVLRDVMGDEEYEENYG